MGKEREHHLHHAGSTISIRSGMGPMLGVLVAIYLVFAVALAHTAFVAIQGRSRAAAGLEASHNSMTAFTELKQQIEELRKQLSESQAASSNSTSSALQQMKAELAQQITQPLQQSSRATDALLDKASKLDQRVAELHSKVSTVGDKIAAPVPAQPAGAHVEDKELHHIVTASSVCDKRGASGLTLNVTGEMVAPLVIVGHNRPGYLAKTMMVLMKYWSADPSYARKFPLFISIDGDDQRTLLLASALHQASGVQIITRRRGDGPPCPAADCHISQHYKLLLRLFLECMKAPGLIFLEEDLEVAPDFFSYFEATTPLMEKDGTIYCVSAWNDHGQRGRVKDNTALYRTDVMPGLGWYVNAKIGLELAPKWPLTNWDDWMRLPSIKMSRSCIYPEVSRTYTFGRVGTHMGEGFDNHLGVMQLNSQPVNWTAMDLSYLTQDNYQRLLYGWMDKAEVFNGTLAELQSYCAIDQPDDTEHPSDLVYKYHGTRAGYESTAKYLKPMMGDVREGTPRGSYKMNLVVRCRGRRLFLRAS